MSLVDIMIDIETLGTAPGSVILSVGAAASNGVELFHQVSLADSLFHGFTVDPETMAWWRKQDPSVWSKQTQGDLSPVSALACISEWIQSIRNGDSSAETGNRIRVWGDGATFDCVLLEEAYRRVGLACPWTYAEVYCYRTVRQLKDSKKPIPKEHHNALSDAKTQLAHLRELLAT